MPSRASGVNPFKRGGRPQRIDPPSKPPSSASRADGLARSRRGRCTARSTAGASPNACAASPPRRSCPAARSTKDSYLQAQCLRLKTRRGPKKAILAVAASMLTATYHMLQRGVPYRELGATHFDRRDQAKLTRRLIRRLHDLGLTVEVRPAA